MIKPYLLVLLVITVLHSPVFAHGSIEAKLEHISHLVNQEAADIEDNCLIVAIEKQRRLLAKGIVSEIVAFIPWKATRDNNQNTDLGETSGHAVLCVEDKCVDNGSLSNYVFDRDEIRFHGEILENYRGRQLAGY